MCPKLFLFFIFKERCGPNENVPYQDFFSTYLYRFNGRVRISIQGSKIKKQKLEVELIWKINQFNNKKIYKKLYVYLILSIILISYHQNKEIKNNKFIINNNQIKRII